MRQSQAAGRISLMISGGQGSSDSALFQADMDVLLLCECDQLAQAFLPADARLLPTAEWCPEKVLRDFVDPHEPGFDLHCGTMSLGEVVRPNGASQAVLHAIDLLEHVRLIRPARNGQDGTEDLFAGNAHVRGHIGENRRFDVEAAG